MSSGGRQRGGVGIIGAVKHNGAARQRRRSAHLAPDRRAAGEGPEREGVPGDVEVAVAARRRLGRRRRRGPARRRRGGGVRAAPVRASKADPATADAWLTLRGSRCAAPAGVHCLQRAAAARHIGRRACARRQRPPGPPGRPASFPRPLQSLTRCSTMVQAPSGPDARRARPPRSTPSTAAAAHAAARSVTWQRAATRPASCRRESTPSATRMWQKPISLMYSSFTNSWSWA